MYSSLVATRYRYLTVLLLYLAILHVPQYIILQPMLQFVYVNSGFSKGMWLFVGGESGKNHRKHEMPMT